MKQNNNTKWLTGAMEIYDNRRGPPHEEPPLQADASTEHVLYRPASAAVDGDSVAE